MISLPRPFPRGLAPLLLALAASAGCVELDGATRADGDAGPDGSTDTGPSDASGDTFPGTSPDTATSDASPPPRSTPEGFPVRAGSAGLFADAAEDPGLRGTGDISGRLSCYDGIDNDDSLGTDCDDASCQGLSSCCVGHGDCCSALPAPPLPRSTSFMDCTGSVATCLADADVEASLFGSPEPFVDGGHLAPGGDADFDSGALIGGAVDLTTHRVSVSATFFGAAGCGDTCLESAGLGFTDQVLDDSSHVRPLAALLMSGARGTISLVVADELVSSWPLGDDGDRWGLTLRPTGELSVERNGAPMPLTRASFLPRRGARLVVYGRSRNPTVSMLAGARVDDLVADVSLCDMPATFTDRAPLDVRFEGNPVASPELLSAPALATDGVETRLVFARQGALHLALQNETEPHRFDLVAALDEPLLAPTHPHESGGLDDPELLFVDGQWVLYYTATDSEGRSSIGRATVDADGGFVADSLPPLAPASFGFDALSSPTLELHDSATLLVARGDIAGRSSLVAFFDRGGGFELLDGGNLASATDPTSQSVAADELGDPSLVVHNGAYQLYVAERRGTRWGVTLLASDELVYFRRVEERALGASGQGFDRLGARHPAALPSSDGVDIVYLGDDGVRSSLGLARRDATSFGTFR